MNARRPCPRCLPWLFAAPFLAVFVLFVAWPLGQSLLLSFQQTYGPRYSTWVGVGNFAFMLHDPSFWLALRNTVVIALAALVVQTPVSLALAMLLNRPGVRGRAVFRLALFAPSLVGLVFAAMLFSMVLERRYGLLNLSLHWLLPSFDTGFAWRQELPLFSLVLASLWLHTGFYMVYFLAALQGVPHEQEESALIDGAGPWQRFRYIVWPEIRPVAGFVTLLSLVGSFQLFELPWLLLDYSAGPTDNRGLTIMVYLYQTGFQSGDLGYASAIGWVLALILMAFTWGQRRLLGDGTD
jgi:ABC-type sugar transport system permease subunit